MLLSTVASSEITFTVLADVALIVRPFTVTSPEIVPKFLKELLPIFQDTDELLVSAFVVASVVASVTGALVVASVVVSVVVTLVVSSLVVASVVSSVVASVVSTEPPLPVNSI